METWEYHTGIWTADMKDNEVSLFLKQRWPDVQFQKFAIQALIPKLNAWGQEGWELVAMEPVKVGENGDVRSPATASYSSEWTNAYMVALKRRLPDTNSE